MIIRCIHNGARGKTANGAQRTLILILLTFVFISLEVRADMTSSFSCAERVLAEFARPPQDDLGFITHDVELTAAHLIEATRRSVFPWDMHDDRHANWHRPPLRGVLALDKVHFSKTDLEFFAEALAGDEYKVTFDTQFSNVVAACKQPRRTYNPVLKKMITVDSWLTPTFETVYQELFELGYAHSVEVWRGNEMVAGFFGLYIDGLFSGQSMFFVRGRGNNAGKLALYVFFERMRALGHTHIDTQTAHGLFAQIGAREWPNASFERLREDARLISRPFPRGSGDFAYRQFSTLN